MRSMSLRLLLSVLVALGLGAAVPAQVACACSCAEVGTAEALRNASAVFEGDVVSLTQPSTGSSDEPIAYTVAVTTVYKGSLPATVVVRSAASEASCGVELKGHVTVFAHGDNDALNATLCSAPVRLNRAELGEGHTPVAVPSAATVTTPAGRTTPAPTTQPTSTEPLLWGGVALLLGAAALVIWLARRR